MRTELISIETETTPLDGVFCQPDDGPGRQGVLLFHGNTMNFYIGAPRFLPPLLTQQGFSCLAFNRRGHDILSIRDSFAANEGAALQLTREGIEDNKLAAAWMAKRGFAEPIVIGHSNGGTLGVQHVVDHPKTPALVLLSAHRGGDSAMAAQRQRNFLAGNKVDEVFARAQALVASGRGKELMMVPGWWFVISGESFIDRMTKMPDIVELAPRVQCPVLYIRGDQEPTAAVPAETYREHAGGSCDLEVIADCDHFYVGRETEVSRVVSAWLTRRFG
jgi:pimeloyl-ACP methyl ester carboxylesterase